MCMEQFPLASLSLFALREQQPFVWCWWHYRICSQFRCLRNWVLPRLRIGSARLLDWKTFATQNPNCLLTAAAKKQKFKYSKTNTPCFLFWNMKWWFLSQTASIVLLPLPAVSSWASFCLLCALVFAFI